MKRYFFIFFILVGCASQPKPKVAKPLTDQGPVLLKLSPVVGAGDRTAYRSRSVTKTFSNGAISRKISEGVDFTIDTKVTHFDKEHNVGTYELTTVEKDGKSELSDFAMPELGESLQFVLAANGEVIRAGQMPAGTLYYVPPVSLPKKEVQVGDSWPLTAEWMSLKTGIPLKMQIVSILKNIRDCGAAGKCAEIEISGDVSVLGSQNNTINPAPLDDKEIMMRFRSEVKGRILLSMSKGSVLYSFMRSDEALSGVTDSVQVSSCMVSYVTAPESDKVIGGQVKECNPTGEVPTL